MTKMVARYCINGLGYEVWSPGNYGLPEFWFSTIGEVRAFAEEMDWTLKSI